MPNLWTPNATPGILLGSGDKLYYCDDCPCDDTGWPCVCTASSITLQYKGRLGPWGSTQYIPAGCVSSSCTLIQMRDPGGFTTGTKTLLGVPPTDPRWADAAWPQMNGAAPGVNNCFYELLETFSTPVETHTFPGFTGGPGGACNFPSGSCTLPSYGPIHRHYLLSVNTTGSPWAWSLKVSLSSISASEWRFNGGSGTANAHTVQWGGSVQCVSNPPYVRNQLYLDGPGSGATRSLTHTYNWTTAPPALPCAPAALVGLGDGNNVNGPILEIGCTGNPMGELDVYQLAFADPINASNIGIGGCPNDCNGKWNYFMDHEICMAIDAIVVTAAA